MSDLAELLKELEQVAKDTNLKEIKEEPVEEIVTSKDDVSSLFEGLEAAYTESKIEEEIKNRLSEEDEQKLNAFSGFMQSVTELTNKPDSNKSIEDLFATIAPPQPQTKTPDVPIVEETIEEVVEEPIEIEQADTIIEQIVSSLDDMNDKTDVQEQVEQISKLRDEFNNFRALVQQQMSSTGSGEVKLEFLDDVQRSTAKVDGKFLKFDSSSGKFVGDEPSVTSLAITALDIDGATDIGANLADADLFIVDDGAGGTNRKSTLARLKTYIGSGSSAADDISAGDAAVNITTSSGNITIDAAANNSDIILKGTDGGSDTTFLTIDGSAAGKATFNDEIVSGAVITSGAGLVIADDGNIGSASDTDAIAIASDGVVTMNQIPVFSAGVNVSGGTIAGTLSTAAQGNITSLGTLTTLTVDNIIINGTNIGHTSDTDSIAIASDGVVTFSQAPVFPDGSINIADLDIDGGTDIGANLADADLIIVDDGAGGTNRKATLARLKTYIGSGATAADDISAGDAAVTITTSSGDITIDAAANNSDIILKGTDGGSDTTFLTIDGSAAGKATFNDEIVSGAVITSGAGLVIADNGNIGSASDTDSIAIASDGVVTFSQAPVFPNGSIDLADLDIDGGTDIGAGLADADLFIVDDGAGGTNRKTAASRIKTYIADVTLTTAAQTNITSLGTLTALTVDNVVVNGSTIGHTDDTDLMTVADGILTVAGEVQMTTLDIGGTNVTSTAAELNLLDGSSANSVVNSKAVIYGSSGELAGTLSTAAQGNVTSLGTLTTLTVDNIIINGANIGHTSDTDSIAIASNGVVTFSQAPVFPNGSIDLVDLDIDGGTDIGAGLADADLFIVDDGAGGTNRKTAASRIKTYIADVTLTTAAQTNITSLGTLTALTVDNVVINGATIGHTDDTDLMTVADGVLTVAGEVDAVSLDVSGDVDIDGTLEADAITVNGTTLAETISDTVGAMVGSNTETGITVTYQDSDNTIDFAINAAQTTITSILATDLKIGEDDQTKIDFETADEIHFYAANEHQIKLVNGALVPVTDNDIDLGTSSLEFKDAFFDGTVTSDAFAGPLTGDVTGNADTATALATARTIHGVSFDGSANIDLSEVIQDTVGAMLSSNTETGITATYQDSDGTIDLVIATLNQDTTGNAATATALETARTIHGVSFDGSANIDLSEVIEDTVGAMFSSNTETGITATYQDADGTIDLVIATLNQDTTGNAATATALETARTIGGVSFDGSANIDLLATDIKIGEDDQTKIDFETADEIHFYAANAEQVFVSDGVFGPQTDSDVDLGTNSTRFKDAFIDTVTTTGLITSGSNLVIADAGNIGSASDTDAIAIASDGVVTFSQAPVFPDGSINIADLDIDGGTDIGAAIVDADLFIVDDGAGGTNRKTAASRLKTYIQDAGTVLQVVTASNSGSVNTTSTSFADITDVTVNITPASSSNKILVLTNSDGVYNLTIGANVTYTQKVLRDSTSLGERSTTAASGGGGLQSRGSMTLARLDSPSSTSQLTYKVQHKISNSSSTGTAVNTHITLLEIQG